MRVSRGITQDAEFEELGRRGYIGNLNDRQYKLLGNMGLRGALTDRIRSSAISAYALAAVDNKLPPLVMDMKEEDYFSNNTIGSFAEVAEHSRAGNATMTDSDGLLKWGPHNLLTYSDDISAIPWTTTSATINSATQFTFDTDGGYIRRGLTVDNAIYTLKATISGDTPGDTFILELVDGADGSDQNYTTVTVSETPTEYTVVADMSSGTFSGTLLVAINRTSLDRSITAGSKVTIEKIHVYRSDLGGMVDNPDRGDSYVPTTSSAVYLPRVNHHAYNGSQWVNKGLLVESEARTNLVTYSSEFASISGTRVIISSDAATGPDGKTSADKIVATSVSGSHDVYTPYSFSLSTKYNLSVFAKAAEYDYVALNIYDGSASHWTWFNLASGVKGTVGATEFSSIEDVGGGWYRCSITVTTAASGTPNYRVYVSNADGALLYTGDDTSGIYLYGLQLEQASTPSSYIPTSGSSVTRAAETLTIPSENLPWPEPVYVTNEELVTNGTFDTDTDWNKQAGWTISGGTANVDSSVAGSTYLRNGTSVVGKVYEITYEVTSITSGTIRAAAGTQLGPIQATTTGTYTDIVVANNTEGLGVYAVGSTTVASVDNISVKEINPLALSIQMKGEMTYADTDTLEVVFLRWLKDADNQIQHYVVTNTGTGEPRILQKSGGVLDYIGTASGDYYSPDINVPFNIASRHGSTFINGAVDGVALTANTTPVALPDLSTTDLSLGYDFMGTIKTFRMWADDIGDAGIEEATS